MVESVDFIQRTEAMSYAQFPRMSLPHVTERCISSSTWLTQLNVTKFVHKYAMFREHNQCYQILICLKYICTQSEFF